MHRYRHQLTGDGAAGTDSHQPVRCQPGKIGINNRASTAHPSNAAAARHRVACISCFAGRETTPNMARLELYIAAILPPVPHPVYCSPPAAKMCRGHPGSHSVPGSIVHPTGGCASCSCLACRSAAGRARDHGCCWAAQGHAVVLEDCLVAAPSALCTVGTPQKPDTSQKYS